MKKIITILFMLVFVTSLFGQAPSSFSYQAILTDASGAARANKSVTVKFEILQASATGTVVYTETHSVTTSSSGLINLNVGTGTTTNNPISSINWSSGIYFLKVTVDGVVYGTTQLLSVPYAQFASKAGNGFSGNYNDLSNKPDLTVGAVKKLTVSSETTVMDEPLFEVKNKAGQTVFAVYNEGVRVFVGDGTAKGAKGGFAIGGFASSKAPSQEFLVVNPDSIRMYVEEIPAKGSKGGFAIGSFSPGKAATQNLLVVNTDSIRAFIDTNTGKGSKGGFAIGGFSPGKGSEEEYLRITRDSTRVYINNTPSKAPKGGFAIGGFAGSKGGENEYLLINPDSTNFYIRQFDPNNSSSFNLFGLGQNNQRRSLMMANPDTIDMEAVLNLQNNMNVYGNIGYTGAVAQIPTPTVTTSSPVNITQTTATSGGEIIDNGGAAIIESGICWSTSTDPTVKSGSKTTDGSASGPFTSSMTGLTPNTTYYVRAYATNSSGTGYGSTVSFKTASATTTVTDIEGNIYNTVVIGTQTWMASNLRTTKFNDGTQITKVTDGAAWTGQSSSAYTFYNNDSLTYAATYGALYNQYAAASGKLCPTGWHVPKMSEWNSMVQYLGGDQTAGGKIKETGLIHWMSPNTGATNSSGFTALPGGLRTYMGPFSGLGDTGMWWSSSEMSAMDAFSASVNAFNGMLMVQPSMKGAGQSIRCLKGALVISAAVLTTQPAAMVYSDSFETGGVITDDGGSTVTERGVCYSTSPLPTIAGPKTSNGTGIGSFMSFVSGLNSTTTYYVRAYATNSFGTSYGNQIIVTTQAAK